MIFGRTISRLSADATNVYNNTMIVRVIVNGSKWAWSQTTGRYTVAAAVFQTRRLYESCCFCPRCCCRVEPCMLVWPRRCKGRELCIAGVYVQGDERKFIGSTSLSTQLKETTTSGRATMIGKNVSLRPILLRLLLCEGRILSASIASTVVRCLHFLLDRRTGDQRVISVLYRQQHLVAYSR